MPHQILSEDVQLFQRSFGVVTKGQPGSPIVVSDASVDDGPDIFFMFRSRCDKAVNDEWQGLCKYSLLMGLFLDNGGDSSGEDPLARVQPQLSESFIEFLTLWEYSSVRITVSYLIACDTWLRGSLMG